jgi:type IV pilus assembly protein PilM
MLNAKSFLAVDFGAANLKLVEFELNEAGGLLLRQYGFKSLGQEGTQEATRESAVGKGLHGLLAEIPHRSKNINICAPGFHTFSKFVKLPPVDTSKVTQIIQYEAQQNVPFPLEEVVWDYQILGATATGELEVLLVAIKSEIVEGLFKTAESAGLRLQLVDVSPAALCNAFRYNYGDLEGCTMLLDIGAKTSNLLFFEKGSVYSRGINIGANSITQDFSKEARLSYTEAERLKIEEGFVSLGGAYEEPESPTQAAISKIARQVMTRLHIQVNQTVQFYRGQQGGSAPQRLFLSGGAAIMPYTAQFFAEKLNLTEVEYFNPLRNLQIDPALNREELAKVAHSLGEVVGLGLRNLAHCPVELNLMPKSSIKRREFNQKKPYLVASVLGLILQLFAIGLFYQKVAAEKNKALDELTNRVAPLQHNDQALRDAMREVKGAELQLEQFTTWMEDRFYWARMLVQLREAFMAVEEKKEAELTAKTGVWIEKMVPMTPSGPLLTATGLNPDIIGPVGSPAGAPGRNPPAARAAKAGATRSSTNEITGLNLTCRAMNLSSLGPAVNGNIAFAVREELARRVEFFDPTNTALPGAAVVDANELTFSFEVTVKFKRAFKF